MSNFYCAVAIIMLKHRGSCRKAKNVLPTGQDGRYDLLYGVSDSNVCCVKPFSCNTSFRRLREGNSSNQVKHHKSFADTTVVESQRLSSFR